MRGRVSPTVLRTVSPGPVGNWEVWRRGAEGEEGPAACFPDVGFAGIGAAWKLGRESWGQRPLGEHLGPTGFLPISKLARGGSLQVQSSGVPSVPIVLQFQTDIPDYCQLLRFWFS